MSRPETGSDAEAQIETPEEYRQTRRTDTILDARKTARDSFNEAIEVANRHGSDIAGLYVHRSVTSYVEELSYHMQNTEAGQSYWRDVELGTITIPPATAHDDSGRSKDEESKTKEWPPIEVVGLRQYLALPERISRQHTLEVYRRFQGHEDVTVTSSTTVPIDISRVAYRSTNYFAEEMGVGLDVGESNREATGRYADIEDIDGL